MEEPEDPGEPHTRPAAVLQRRGTAPTIPTVKSVLLRARVRVRVSSQSLGAPRPEEHRPPCSWLPSHFRPSTCAPAAPAPARTGAQKDATPDSGTCGFRALLAWEQR